MSLCYIKMCSYYKGLSYVLFATPRRHVLSRRGPYNIGVWDPTLCRFLTLHWVGLQCTIAAFPGNTHLFVGQMMKYIDPDQIYYFNMAIV